MSSRRFFDSVAACGRELVTIATANALATDPRVRDGFFIVESNREQLCDIGSLLDRGELRAIVEAVFPLAEARQAYARARQGSDAREDRIACSDLT